MNCTKSKSIKRDYLTGSKVTNKRSCHEVKSIRYITAHEMRIIDEKCTTHFKIPSIVLMENAGRQVAETIMKRSGKDKKVIIIFGKGKNGGDGLVCARHLYNNGYGVSLVATFDLVNTRLDSDTEINLEIARKMGIKRSDLKILKSIDPLKIIVVDAILGIGLKKELSGDLTRFVGIVNELKSKGAYVVAVDIPSGMDSDSGLLMPLCVKADVTVTMGLPKRGFLSDSAKKYTGEIIVADIGAPKSLLGL